MVLRDCLILWGWLCHKWKKKQALANYSKWPPCWSSAHRHNSGIYLEFWLSEFGFMSRTIKLSLLNYLYVQHLPFWPQQHPNNPGTHWKQERPLRSWECHASHFTVWLTAYPLLHRTRQICLKALCSALSAKIDQERQHPVTAGLWDCGSILWIFCITVCGTACHDVEIIWIDSFVYGGSTEIFKLSPD